MQLVLAIYEKKKEVINMKTIVSGNIAAAVTTATDKKRHFLPEVPAVRRQVRQKR